MVQALARRFSGWTIRRSFSRDEPKNGPEDHPVVFCGPVRTTGKVSTIDLATGQLTDLFVLPEWWRHQGEPRLRPLGSDGVPRIVLGDLGLYRIDVKKKQLVEDNTLCGEYRYTQGREAEKFFYRDTLLAEEKRIAEIGVSPDGRRAVWLTAYDYRSELHSMMLPAAQCGPLPRAVCPERAFSGRQTRSLPRPPRSVRPRLAAASGQSLPRTAEATGGRPSSPMSTTFWP